MVKNICLFIFSDPEIVFLLCFVCWDAEIMFLHFLSIFDKDHGNVSFHGKKLGDMVPILLIKNVLLTFQIEQNGTFLDNFKDDYCELLWDIFMHYDV